jgi:hypothetical protein
MKKSKDAAKPAKGHAPKAKSCFKGHRKNGGESRLGIGEASHPETVTSNLVLHAMLHVQSWPDQDLSYRSQLFDYCYQALKCWAEGIQKSGASTMIGLRAVLDYALLLKKDQKHSDWSLEEAGNAVIKLDAFVSDRLQTLWGKEERAAEAQRILSSEDRISVFQAAKEITGLTNTTDAVRRLKMALRRLSDDYARGQSPPHMLALGELLKQALIVDSKKEKNRKILPRELIRIFTPFLQSFLAQQKANVRQIAALESHRSRENPR